MPLDKKIAAAVRASVAAEKQPDQVADRLNAWLEELSNGNESLGNPESTSRYLNDLFEAIEPDPAAGDAE